MISADCNAEIDYSIQKNFFVENDESSMISTRNFFSKNMNSGTKIRQKNFNEGQITFPQRSQRDP